MKPPEFLRRLPENIEARAFDWYVAGLLVLLALLGWSLARIAPPPPPKRVVMTTGAEDGAYHRFAQRYRELLAANGVELVLRPSSGAAQKLELLLEAARTVHGGASPLHAAHVFPASRAPRRTPAQTWAPDWTACARSKSS